jgi:hypothetical protein
VNRVETSQGSTRSWFNCDTGVFVSKTASSDLRVERTQPVPKLAGWIPPNEVVQLVVGDQVRGTPKDDGKHSGQMSRRFVPKHEFSPRDQRSPFGPKAGLFGEFPNCCVLRRLSDLERPSRQLPLLSSDVETDEHLLAPSNYDKGTGGRHCSVKALKRGVVESSERHESSASVVVHREFHFGRDRTIGSTRSFRRGAGIRTRDLLVPNQAR